MNPMTPEGLQEIYTTKYLPMIPHLDMVRLPGESSLDVVRRLVTEELLRKKSPTEH